MVSSCRGRHLLLVLSNQTYPRGDRDDSFGTRLHLLVQVGEFSFKVAYLVVYVLEDCLGTRVAGISVIRRLTHPLPLPRSRSLKDSLPSLLLLWLWLWLWLGLAMLLSLPSFRRLLSLSLSASFSGVRSGRRWMVGWGCVVLGRGWK